MNSLYDLDRNYLNMLLTRIPTMKMLDKKKNLTASLKPHKAATEQIGQLNGCKQICYTRNAGGQMLHTTFHGVKAV